MQLSNSAENYGAIPQAVHWLTVVLVVAAWLLGILGDELPKGALRSAGSFFHATAGLAVIVLLLVRVAWRLIDPPPPAEAVSLGVWQDRAAGLVHLVLYGLLLAVPVVGIVLQFARGDALPLFGLAEIPSPWIRDRAFAHNVKEVHEIMAHGLMLLAALHATAALIHHRFFHDRTLLRMLPHR